MDNDLVTPQSTQKPRHSPGRPHEGQSDGTKKVERPQKYEREDVQPREGLGAGETRFVAENSDTVTRSAAGSIPELSYAKQHRDPTLAEEVDESSSNDNESFSGRESSEEPPRRDSNKIPKRRRELSDEADPFQSSDKGSEGPFGFIEDSHYGTDGEEDLGPQRAGELLETTAESRPGGTRPQIGAKSRIDPEKQKLLLQRSPQDLIPNRSNLAGIRARYWSRKMEEAMEESWPKPPPEWLDSGDDFGVAELRLWKTMLICFDAIPQQLFTYGLKPQGAFVSGSSIRLDPKYCRDLELICTHPIWGGDLGKLRYALQTAVALGITNHIEPINPLSPNVLRANADVIPPYFVGDPKEMLSKYQYVCGTAFDPLDDQELRPVINELQRTTIGYESDETSQMLFLLKPASLEAVLSALDATSDVLSVREWNERFHSRYSDIYEMIAPRGQRELVSIIWACELSEKRDEEICRAISVAQASEEFLLDVPSLGSRAGDVRFN
ncbi:hypothetical protein F5Y11DRAFT_326927 [Daldinia sp. FL1419]|nr:hypothetical protein F5Y11DRAFT_326927 [Daldinia sp. FL1419]